MNRNINTSVQDHNNTDFNSLYQRLLDGSVQAVINVPQQNGTVLQHPISTHEISSSLSLLQLQNSINPNSIPGIQVQEISSSPPLSSSSLPETSSTLEELRGQEDTMHRNIMRDQNNNHKLTTQNENGETIVTDPNINLNIGYNTQNPPVQTNIDNIQNLSSFIPTSNSNDEISDNTNGIVNSPQGLPTIEERLAQIRNNSQPQFNLTDALIENAEERSSAFATSATLYRLMEEQAKATADSYRNNGIFGIIRTITNWIFSHPWYTSAAIILAGGGAYLTFRSRSGGSNSNIISPTFNITVPTNTSIPTPSSSFVLPSPSHIPNYFPTPPTNAPIIPTINLPHPSTVASSSNETIESVLTHFFQNPHQITFSTTTIFFGLLTITAYKLFIARRRA